MRDAQTDTCHGTCGAGCPCCDEKFEINFRPMDIRTQFLMGGADPKLDGVGKDADADY
jgi:hypothetical protein